MPRKKKSPDDYFANAENSWVSACMRANNGFNPVGFQRVADEGKFLITTKSARGFVPMKPNRQQRELERRIIENRKAGKPTRIIIVKGRQGAGITTGVARIFSGELFANRGVSIKVSGVDPVTLDDIWDKYRTMFDSYTGKLTADGGYADDVDKPRGERANQRKLQVAATGSRMTLVNAGVKDGANLGRGGSPLHWHGSEADYYPDFKKAMKAIMPSLSSDPMSIAILETTMNMEASTYFKEFVRRNVEHMADKDADHEGLWDVWFIPWFEMEMFQIPFDTYAAEAEFLNTCTAYELDLHKLGASPAALRWRRRELNNQFGGDARDFAEAYPSTLKEALDSWGVAEYLRRDAVEFYQTHTVREPMARYVMDCTAAEPMVELTDPRDFDLVPHVKVWGTPVSGREYHIAADCASSDARLTTAGSKNFAVLLDTATGEQLASFCALCPTYTLTDAITALGTWFNHALLAPESNHDGRAVIERLNVVHRYPNIYRRERVDAEVLSETDVLGFHTGGETRQLLIDKMRWCFNTRRLLIRDQELLDQIVAFGRRGGAKLTQLDKARGLSDDGVIALGIACTIRDFSSRWRPHSIEQRKHEKPKESKKPVASNGRIKYNVPDPWERVRSQRERRMRRLLNRT